MIKSPFTPRIMIMPGGTFPPFGGPYFFIWITSSSGPAAAL